VCSSTGVAPVAADCVVRSTRWSAAERRRRYEFRGYDEPWRIPQTDSPRLRRRSAQGRRAQRSRSTDSRPPRLRFVSKSNL